MPVEGPRPRTDPSLTSRPTAHGKLEAEFDGFGDRAGKFVRSLLTLAEFRGELSSYAAEPNLRIVRSAFGKWALEVLAILAPRRRVSFGELRHELPGISARVLSGKLRLLEEAGLVVRTVLPVRPPRPEYALTERGHALVRAAAKVLHYARATSPLSRRAVPPAAPHLPSGAGEVHRTGDGPAAGPPSDPTARGGRDDAAEGASARKLDPSPP